MTKFEFITKLYNQLTFLPKGNKEERIAFYSEIIEDKIEEGFSEEEAVKSMGDIDSIVKQILDETPFTKLVNEKVREKRTLKVWEIVFLVLGSPIWLPLLISAFAVILSFFVVLWSLIISLWAIFVLVVACVLGGIVSGIYFIFSGNTLSGVAMLSAGVICIGLSIFIFYGCKAATKGNIILAKNIVFSIKKCFIRKVEA